MINDSATETPPEHIALHAHKTINLFINDEKFRVESPSTGDQIATLGAIPAGNQLFLEVPGPGDDLQIARDRTIKLRSGMRFYDVPAGNLG